MLMRWSFSHWRFADLELISRMQKGTKIDRIKWDVKLPYSFALATSILVSCSVALYASREALAAFILHCQARKKETSEELRAGSKAVVNQLWGRELQIKRKRKRQDVRSRLFWFPPHWCQQNSRSSPTRIGALEWFNSLVSAVLFLVLLQWFAMFILY